MTTPTTRLTAIPVNRRNLLLGAASLAATTALPAWAQSYPSKPITLVVPFPPGGPTDLVARVLAQQLTQQLGQSVVIDNKPGANGNIGNAAVAKAAADGHTLLYNTSSIAVSPALYKSLAYHVERDFTPVALTAVVPLVLVVNPSLPVNSVGEFVAHARANPGKLSYGSAGNGNITHLAAHQMVRHFGLEVAHVPYKGSAPADMDLVAGQVQFMTDTINSVLPFIRDQKLKALAVTTPRRVALLPNVPTLAESGMPGFEAGAWQGVMAPAKTPEATVARLNAEILKALKSRAVLDKLEQQGAEPLGSTPAEYSAYVKKELARWGEVVKATGVTMD